MKKIISIVLVLACMFTFFSCGGDGESTAASLKEINDMYNAITPSMVETVTTRNFGDYSLESKGTLKVGSSGAFAVAVYELLRQTNFIDLETAGQARTFEW